MAQELPRTLLDLGVGSRPDRQSCLVDIYTNPSPEATMQRTTLTLQDLETHPPHLPASSPSPSLYNLSSANTKGSGMVYQLAGGSAPHRSRTENRRHRSVFNRPSFEVFTDPRQGDKSTEIRLLSFQRPHMRAFHLSWLSFFFASFGWLSIPPLMPTIKKQLSLTQTQVDNSNIISLAGTIASRLVIGPLCDRYGARTIQAALLVLGTIPVAAAALVVDYVGLMVVRFFVGFIGCSFVATTYWTSTMFATEVVGSANALASGWGNLGAGVTYLVMPLLFDLITIDGSVSDNYGWRLALVTPAVFMVTIGVCTYFFSDDCPQGNYSDLKRSNAMANRAKSDMYDGFIVVAKQPVTWILAFQYACSFGVELQVHNVLSLYYYEDFKHSDCDPTTDADECRLLTQTKASLISSCFGLMCIFARAFGGYLSDVANQYFDMKGRISAQLVCLTAEAVFLYVYSQVRDAAWSIPCLVAFSVFVQASAGTTYGIVPYVSPGHMGTASGIVGAGGNVGGLAWGFLFQATGNRAMAFRNLSFFVMAAAVLSGAIRVEGERSLWSADIAKRRRDRTNRPVR